MRVAGIRGARISLNLSSVRRHILAKRACSSVGENATAAWASPTQMVLAGSGAVVLAGFLLSLKETRRGISEALSGNQRSEVSSLWSYGLGLAGGVAGYSGTLAFVSRIGSTNPLLAGIKVPFALFGALMGGQLSFYMAPILVDVSRSLSMLLSFALDGLVADTIGRPEGQPPAWEATSLVDKIMGVDKDLSLESSEAPKDGALHNRMTSLLQGVGSTQMKEDLSVGSTQMKEELACEERQEELKWLAGKLVKLRVREEALDAAHAAAPSRHDATITAERQKAERTDIIAKKEQLKRLAVHRLATKLSKFVQSRVQESKDNLTQLRLRQYELGSELGGGRLDKRHANDIMAELRKIEKEKKQLKLEARRNFGVRLGRVTRRVKKWQEAKK